jgi:hypothetical protein
MRYALAGFGPSVRVNPHREPAETGDASFEYVTSLAAPARDAAVDW